MVKAQTREDLTQLFLDELGRRSKEGASCRELAKLVGADHASVIRWLSGQSKPGISAIIAGLKGFGDDSRAARPLTGRVIRARRIDAGLSQLELARLTGIKQARLSKIESNHLPVTLSDFERVERALNLSINDPFTYGEEVPWSELEVGDLDACERSYQSLVRIGLFRSEVPTQTWMIALRSRLKELESTSEQAQMLLSWLYGSHSYYFAANGKSGELAKCLVGRLNYSERVGFDLTSGYQVWAFARTAWESGHWRRFDGFIDVIHTKYGPALERAQLPYSHYISALQCHVRGDEKGTKSSLQSAQTLVPEYDDGQFGSLGGQYMVDCASSYLPMFQLSRRDYRGCLNSLENWSPSTSLFRVIHAGYVASALSGLSDLNSGPAWERFGGAAATEAREADLPVIRKHLRRLGVRNIPNLHHSTR